MKLYPATLILLAFTVIAPTQAALRRLTQDEHSRFLQEKEQLQDQVRAWKQSDAGKYAIHHGFVDPEIQDDSNQVSDEELQRFFMTKLGIERVEKRNPEATFSTNSPFTMMTDEEFAKFVGGSFNRTSSPFRDSSIEVASAQHMDYDPAYVYPEGRDWSTSGCVAPVKDQGYCGSCWAFAAVTAIESAYCWANGGSFQRFSEQQVTSCETSSGGCDGGWPANALKFIMDRGSICTDSSYSYESGTSQETGSCRQDSCSTVSVNIKQVVSADASEMGFIFALDYQPMVVTVSAGNSVWKQYAGGVVSSCDGSGGLDHAVTAVGYGTSTSDYFKIQNSWGTSWGDQGFIYLSRSGSTCGVVNDEAVYPEF